MLSQTIGRDIADVCVKERKCTGGVLNIVLYCISVIMPHSEGEVPKGMFREQSKKSQLEYAVKHFEIWGTIDLRKLLTKGKISVHTEVDFLKRVLAKAYYPIVPSDIVNTDVKKWPKIEYEKLTDPTREDQYTAMCSIFKSIKEISDVHYNTALTVLEFLHAFVANAANTNTGFNPNVTPFVLAPLFRNSFMRERPGKYTPTPLEAGETKVIWSNFIEFCIIRIPEYIKSQSDFKSNFEVFTDGQKKKWYRFVDPSKN